MAKKSGLEFVSDLARHAKALYDIIKAALQSGWTGAALAAVKHYWPQILSIAVVILILPVIIFLSLPALIFDAIFGGAESTIEDKIYSAYGDYEMMMDNHMNKLVYEFYQNTGTYTDGNTTRIISGDNNVEGETMDIYWFAAIHAVYIKNDIPTREQIDEFTKNLFSYSIIENISKQEIKTFEKNPKTGKTPPPHTTVYIDRTLTLSYSDPYDLMNRLGFDQSDIAWAENMYTTMISADTEEEITLLTGVSFCNPLPLNWRSAVTSEFGYRTDPVNGGADNHTGIDLAAPLGTDIIAVMDGKVISVVEGTTGYGYFVKIEHSNKLQTMYCHCSEIYVSVDDEVKQGDVIAAVGSTGKSTGNHLHLELRVNGKAVNPRPYLP